MDANATNSAGTGWMVAENGQQHGPYTHEDVQRYLASGSFTGNALVWKQGMSEWVPIGSIFPLPPGAAAAPYRSSTPPQTNKVAAGVLGIVLGGLGIHKFILGLTGPGLIMLLVTVLTCGLGGAVMGIIGLIEGIIYLTKSDEEFYQDYIVNKKPWF